MTANCPRKYSLVLVFAALVVVSVLGLAFYYAVEFSERALVPWAPKFDAMHRT